MTKMGTSVFKEVLLECRCQLPFRSHLAIIKILEGIYILKGLPNVSHKGNEQKWCNCTIST